MQESVQITKISTANTKFCNNYPIYGINDANSATLAGALGEWPNVAREWAEETKWEGLVRDAAFFDCVWFMT